VAQDRLRPRLLPALGFGLLVLAAPAPVAGQATEAGLVQAWEAVQKNDPATTAFEKRAEGSYHFATRRFPFDGELKLLKATIEEPAGADTFAYGIVEVELVALPDKITRDYARSYSLWQATNMLTYDSKAKKWMTSREFAAALRAGGIGSLGSARLWTWGPSVFLLAVFLMILWLLARTQRRQKEYAKKIDRSFERSERLQQLAEKNAALVEKALAVAEDSNRVLKEILEALRRERPG
jgi:hypothetical protein